MKEKVEILDKGRHASNQTGEGWVKVTNTNMTEFEGGGDRRESCANVCDGEDASPDMPACQHGPNHSRKETDTHTHTSVSDTAHTHLHISDRPCVCVLRTGVLAQVRCSMHVCPSSHWHCAAGLFWFLKDSLRWVRRSKTALCWHTLAEWHHLLYTPVDLYTSIKSHIFIFLS